MEEGDGAFVIVTLHIKISRQGTWSLISHLQC